MHIVGVTRRERKGREPGTRIQETGERKRVTKVWSEHKKETTKDFITAYILQLSSHMTIVQLMRKNERRKNKHRREIPCHRHRVPLQNASSRGKGI